MDLKEYTVSVTGYIEKCTDDVTVSKTDITHMNHKPWFTSEVYALIKGRNAAFKSGDREAYTRARTKLFQAIKRTKCAHAKRIHGQFTDYKDTWHMWQEIQSIIDYRPVHKA